MFFAFIVCFFLISLRRHKNGDRRDVFLLRAGMFFTVLADLMMIIFLENTAGLVFFCVCQLIYTARFTCFKNAGITAAAGILVFLVSCFIPAAGIQTRLALCYSVCLLSAVSGSYFSYKKRLSRRAFLALAGMTLFLLCDINVALFNLFAGHNARPVFQVLIWCFYLPSQLLISISGEALLPDC